MKNVLYVTYVKNKEAELAKQPHEVSGMLLYAGTDEAIYPEKEYQMSGNHIEVRTLNLAGNFDMIKRQLDKIAENYFGADRCPYGEIFNGAGER